MREAARLVLGVAAVWLGLGGQPAFAAAPPPSAEVRVGWFTSDHNADVYVDGTRILANLAYKEVTEGYLAVAPGHRLFEFRTAGALPGSSPIASVSGDLAPGSRYTVAAAGNSASQMTGAILPDLFTPPAPGMALLRVVHLAGLEPGVDIMAGGAPQPLVSDLAFGQHTGYLAVPAGTYQVQCRAAADHTLLLDTSLTLRPGSVQTVIGVAGTGRNFELVPLADAAAAPATGGASTGRGGAALPWELAGLGLLALLVALPQPALMRRGG